MTNTERFEAAEAYRLRVVQFVDLAEAIATDQFETPQDAVEELCEELADTSAKDPSMERITQAAQRATEDGELCPELLPEYLAEQQMLGFAIQFATPVVRNATENACSYSWGNYYTQWVYGDTYDQAWTAATAWSDRLYAKAVEKTKAASATA